MNQPNYNTALYMRLSRDDEGYGDSISIETQRTILRKFAQDNQLRIYDEYIDDGWSGTNFERPNFKRVMADIESGKVNCVVTKDLSCALPGFVDSKNEEKTERNAGYLVVSHSGGGMLRQGTRKGIRRTPANRGMRAHRIVKSLDISEDVCHGMCP